MGLKLRSEVTGDAMLVSLGLILSLIFLASAEAVTDSQCKEQRRLGINACKPVLWGAQPSSACCYRIRVTHISCVCSVITPEITALVKDRAKFYQMIERCGRRVPRHYRCGSITTPS